MRIKEHPVLGKFEKGEEVSFTFDGKEIKGCMGGPLSAALSSSGVTVHRHTEKGSARGIFCAIGRCTDCVMIVEGKSNVRTCITPLKAGTAIDIKIPRTTITGKRAFKLFEKFLLIMKLAKFTQRVNPSIASIQASTGPVANSFL